MVQLDALATGAQYRGGGLPPVLDAALAEARRICTQNGIGALMVQNLGDIPVALEATREQVAWTTRIASDSGPRSTCLSASTCSKPTPPP